MALCVVLRPARRTASQEVDELAKLNELTKQAQQLIETAQSVQQDLEKKLQLQSDAEQKHAGDLAVLGRHQGAAGRLSRDRRQSRGRRSMRWAHR